MAANYSELCKGLDHRSEWVSICHHFWGIARNQLGGSYRSAGLHCAHFYFLSAVQGYTAHIFIFGLQCRATLRTFLFFEDHNRFIFVPLWQNGQEREKFEKFSIIYSKIVIFWCKNLWKINFLHHFLGLAQNHVQSCRMVIKEKILKNFQFHVVKSSFFEVKTYEKLTFFIVFLDCTVVQNAWFLAKLITPSIFVIATSSFLHMLKNSVLYIMNTWYMDVSCLFMLQIMLNSCTNAWNPLYD